MNEKENKYEIAISGEKLFERVISILEQARTNVVKAVNSNMIIAYWLIGREIVNEIQKGKDRAEYGKKVLADLSDKLIKRYGIIGAAAGSLFVFKGKYKAVLISYPNRFEKDALIDTFYKK